MRGLDGRKSRRQGLETGPPAVGGAGDRVLGDWAAGAEPEAGLEAVRLGSSRRGAGPEGGARGAGQGGTARPAWGGADLAAASPHLTFAERD